MMGGSNDNIENKMSSTKELIETIATQFKDPV
jgi:hypothetical protein